MHSKHRQESAVSVPADHTPAEPQRTVGSNQRDPLEARIARVFAETFRVDQVDLDDDFFTLGGDSLTGETLATAILAETGLELKISSLVKHSTPRKIAKLLQGNGAAIPAPSRPPIFLVHGMVGFMLPKPEFIGGLAPDQNFRIFELPGIRDGRESKSSIEDVAAEYVAQIETDYPKGPVLLGAYCGGAIIALEMATQFAEKGRPIRQMVLFDPGGIPFNILDHIHRLRFGENGTAADHQEASIRAWGRRLGRQARMLVVRGRWTDGSQSEDIADAQLRDRRVPGYERQFHKRRLRGRQRDHDIPLSSTAQARFFAALHHYIPRPFDGPVDVFSSEAFRSQFESPSSAWTYLLPKLRLHVLGESHSDVIRAEAATGAQLMQKIFDQSLAALGNSAH
jgi:acyl carrier protein